jgi:hypothetical protein
MATTVTVDSIFEQVPSNQQFISVPAVKVAATVFNNSVAYVAPVVTGPLGPSWRKPSREIG